jgi:7-cyano-7-deazaguanine synthase
MKKAVLSLSGGMDSTSLLLHLLAKDYEVKAFSFDYGQRHRIELERVQKNVEKLKLLYPANFVQYEVLNAKGLIGGHSALTSDVDVPTGHYAEENMKKTVVPNRNAIFSSVIYGKALDWADSTQEDVVICLGIHAGDHDVYPDCRKEWRDAIAYAFRIGNWGSERVDYFTPFLFGNKTTILEDAIESCKVLHLDFDGIFRDTNTCYSPDLQGKSCGKCGSCVERVEAFINIDRVARVTYVQDWETVREDVKIVLSL